MSRDPVIGVDFDNTIVCYDALFYKVCCERGLIPAGVSVNKSDVRNYLRRIGREEDWTEVQGHVYGARMAEAMPYPGVKEFFPACRAAGHTLKIISHRTRQPLKGESYDLHRAAFEWLEQEGFFRPSVIGLSRQDIYFELTKQAKLDRIDGCGCTSFIDDLPEFLAEPAFPATTRRILFDPNDLYRNEARFARVTSWAEARTLFSC